MKKTALVITIMALGLSGQAQKVALQTPSGVQYFTGVAAFQNAYAASSDGDIIYLPGGSFNTPSGINKKLTVYGTGHYPDSTQATGKTFLNGNLNLQADADDFYIEGVDINGNVNFADNQSINRVTIKYCKFINSSMTGSRTTPSLNISFINNIAHTLHVGNGQNVLITNNIIRYGIDDTQGNVISNNIFLNRLTTGYYENFRGDNNLVTNNIFLIQGSYGMVYNHQGNQFYNNIMAFANPSYGINAIVSGNYTGINPADIFVNQTGDVFSYSHNYHLNASTVYLGTDGVQAGIYGGSFPYKEGAVPSNPHIIRQNIAPSASDGMLNVQIKASAQDQ